jgi:hypothetical protein
MLPENPPRGKRFAARFRGADDNGGGQRTEAGARAGKPARKEARHARPNSAGENHILIIVPPRRARLLLLSPGFWGPVDPPGS